MNSLSAKLRASGWHPMRWVTLVLGLLFAMNWLVNSAPVSGIISVFLLYQAVTCTGCIAGQCRIPGSDLSREDRNKFEL
ncbi:hypothetical protein [Rhodohalobacter mucosus]|uniref:Uncharacterized protein n=1 Tax=Rhodohalobacter mucosus TaxID=2079485 RepID=A0A316TP29_9BACT|nr:hypothetical protein [Rhodohalobacter mucosus]PWN06140.1 hypothetical protein DDZ15_09860 [Rhodohalobacter mucosus]